MHEVESPPHEVVLESGDTGEGRGIQRVDLRESTECIEPGGRRVRIARVVHVGEDPAPVDRRILVAQARQHCSDRIGGHALVGDPHVLTSGGEPSAARAAPPG